MVQRSTIHAFRCLGVGLREGGGAELESEGGVEQELGLRSVRGGLWVYLSVQWELRTTSE